MNDQFFKEEHYNDVEEGSPRLKIVAGDQEEEIMQNWNLSFLETKYNSLPLM